MGGAPLTAAWAQNAPGERTAPLLPSPAPPETRRTRVGAARALRLVDAEGRALTGDLSEPHWETRGGGLFFTRYFGGTRNIWRAFPDPRDASRYPRWRALPVTQFAAPLFAAGACPLDGDRALLMRSNATNPRAAAQVTRFDLLRLELRALTSVPDGVVGIAPAPDGQSFAFTAATRNLALPGAVLTNPSRNAAGRDASNRAASNRVASSSSDASGAPPSGFSMAVWRQSLQRGAASLELVARNAWRPAWQGTDSILAESVADAAIFRLSLAALGRPNSTLTKLAPGSQISASRDGATLIFVGKSDAGAQLYLLAGDGSGQRALASTEGAEAPALAPDGRMVAFTAPLSQARGEKERALWILPLPLDTASLSGAPFADASPEPGAELEMPVEDAAIAAPGAAARGDEQPSGGVVISPPPGASAENQAPQISNEVAAPGGDETRPLPLKTRNEAPVALIRAVQNAPGGALAIWGTASGRDASATLEIGQGSAPKRWEARPISLPTTPNEPLLLWNPPSPARGVWNFRLSVSGVGGAAQSVFSVQLPLAPRPTPLPNSFPISRGASGVVPGANPRSSLPATRSNRGAMRGAATNSGTANRSTANRSTANNSAANGTTSSMPAGGPLPSASLPDLPAAPLPAPAPLPPLLPLPPAQETPRTAPHSVGQSIGPSAGQSGTLPPRYPNADTAFPPAPRSNPSPLLGLTGRDAATFNVSDTLAQMKVGQRVSVTFWALNRGTRAWLATPSRGEAAGTTVRLVTRWIRFDNGNRNGWSYQTMKTGLAPNARANWKFELVAPTQPGRYKLIYSLQRVAPGWEPPAYNALQETWPGDFAAIAFAVTVKP